jgi:hypothetical protein
VRRIFPRAGCIDDARAHVPGTANEEPATSPSRVRGRGMAAAISGRRLPATRRSRPAR